MLTYVFLQIFKLYTFKISTMIIYLHVAQEIITPPILLMQGRCKQLTVSLHSVLVEGAQHVGEIPAQC